MDTVQQKLRGPYVFTYFTGEVWVILPILVFLSFIGHKDSYISLTLEVYNDRSYILPRQ